MASGTMTFTRGKASAPSHKTEMSVIAANPATSELVNSILWPLCIDSTNRFNRFSVFDAEGFQRRTCSLSLIELLLLQLGACLERLISFRLAISCLIFREVSGPVI